MARTLFDPLSQEQQVTKKEGNFQQKQQGFLQNIVQTGKEFSKGVAKGILSTALGAGQLGQRALQETGGRITEAVTGKPRTSFGVGIFQPETAQDIREGFLTPETGAEQAGFVTEQIAEFLIPSSKVAQVQSLVAKTLPKGAKLLGRATAEATFTGTLRAIQKGELDDEVRTTALIGAAFPIGGAALRGTRQAIGRGLRATGEKISTTIVRPSVQDFADGYKPETLTKHGIGGNLSEMLAQTNNKINSLNKELRSKLGESDVTINVGKVWEKTKRQLLGRPTRIFSDFDPIQRHLIRVKGEIAQVAGESQKVGIVDANWIKRGAGTKGAWAFGNPDREANAIEKVYTTFYRNMREEIENAGPKGIRNINRQIGELIPVNSALLRRMPVEMRNNVISLTDNIAVMGAVFDPRALIVLGANKLSKSGKFANVLVKAGQRLIGGAREPQTALGRRIFGGNITDLRNTPAGLSIQDVSGTKRAALESQLRTIEDNIRRLETRSAGKANAAIKSAQKARDKIFEEIRKLR